MQMVSEERVSQIVEEISEMGPAETQKLATLMQEEQPFVMVYLLAVTQREEFTEDETDLFLFVGIVLWRLMRENPNGKRKVTERILDEAEQSNETLLEKMAEDSEGDFMSASESVALNSQEPEVFRCIVANIMEDEEGSPDGPPFGEEHVGAAFLGLKVVMDAFAIAQK